MEILFLMPYHSYSHIMLDVAAATFLPAFAENYRIAVEHCPEVCADVVLVLRVVLVLIDVERRYHLMTALYHGCL